MTKTSNSLGHQLSHAAQLDGHFALCQTEYEAMAQAVGIKKGAYVLDGGCGTGMFLPLFADIVGPNGEIKAIDIAPENVESSKQLIETLALGKTITIQEGDLTQLEFRENTFDTVWCANVTQYLTDEQLSTALDEMIRVVKPGGLVAIKEYDITTWQYQPAPPDIFPRLFEARRLAGDTQTIGAFRSLNLISWYQQSGLENVWMQNFVSETYAPLAPTHKKHIKGVVGWLANRGLEANVSESDKKIWQQLADVDSADHILNRSDFYARESHILAVGTKPMT